MSAKGSPRSRSLSIPAGSPTGSRSRRRSCSPTASSRTSARQRSKRPSPASPDRRAERREMERVCIVGAGVIGSLYAAHLARVADVCVLTRREEQARALNEAGLKISGKHDFTARLRASVNPAELGDVDLCIVATKATQLEEAAARLAGHFPRATMMTVQNGLGAEEILLRHGAWQVISAVTF